MSWTNLAQPINVSTQYNFCYNVSYKIKSINTFLKKIIIFWNFKLYYVKHESDINDQNYDLYV